MTRLSFPCSLSSAASVASAAANHFSTSASSSLARASIRPYDIALCLEALALIFEPSNATCPSCASPAASHSLRTCTNSCLSACKCRLRKSEMVRKSGASPATIIMQSARSLHALAMRREEKVPLA
jgi:hypothetical protein